MRSQRYSIGGNLRRIRGGMSQSELSRRSGVNRNTIVQLEMGSYMPRVGTLERIAAALGVEIVEFFKEV